MHREFNNFTHTKCWSPVERHDGMHHNVIGTKSNFKNNQDEHEQVTINKARLVAQDFTTS